MVGPMPTDERSRLMRLLKLSFVVLIGASSGLITLLGEPTPLEFALVTGVGLVFGALVVWVVFPRSGDVNRVGR